MIKVIRALSPENGMYFEDICSFETESFLGLWDYNDCEFVLINRHDMEFRHYHLGTFHSLDELDDAVYNECGEHIIGVSDKCNYRITLENDE